MTGPLAPTPLGIATALATLATAVVWVELALGAARSRFAAWPAVAVGLLAALVPLIGHAVAARFLWTHRRTGA